MMSNKQIPTLKEEQLNTVSGGKKTKSSKCPNCKKETMVVKYMRLECTNCHYVIKM